MADDRYGWLDADAAERLLRGEPVVPGGAPETPHQQEQGARDAETAARLDALLRSLRHQGSPRRPADRALPGEEAAVAAFRAARGAPERPSPEVAPGRVRWRGLWSGLGRPVRAGLGVGLLACTLGGVAFAAQTGVLPAPFGRSSAGVGTSSTLSPSASRDATTPDGAPDAPRPSRGSGVDGARGDAGPSASGRDGDGAPDARPGERHGGTPSAGASHQARVELCLRYHDGTLTAVDLAALRRLAGGADAVADFCADRPADERGGGTGGGDETSPPSPTDDPGDDPGDGDGTPEDSPSPGNSQEPTPGSTTPEPPGGDGDQDDGAAEQDATRGGGPTPEDGAPGATGPGATATPSASSGAGAPAPGGTHVPGA